MKRKTFFDSRDKYLSFVNSTNEKSKIAFYLFKKIEKISTRSPIFNVLDAGTGEGTIISTFLSGLHKYLPNKPIFVVGKEISIDDINVLLSFLGDRFAEHKTLIFNITNCNYNDLTNLTPNNVKFEKLELVGNKGIDFTKTLMNLSPYVRKNWKLSFNNKNGSIKPKSKIFLTIIEKIKKMSFLAMKFYPPVSTSFQYFPWGCHSKAFSRSNRIFNLHYLINIFSYASIKLVHKLYRNFVQFEIISFSITYYSSCNFVRISKRNI